MKKYKSLINYFSKTELTLWSVSEMLIIVSFFVCGAGNYLTLIASVIGITSLIFTAKGNPFGQLLMIIFGLIYGVISFGFSYYGEMLTYLGMTVPMSIFALVSWLKNPYKGNKAQVKINHITKKETIFMLVLTAAVTVAFYFILNHFNTANILPSTISVSTSFAAVYLCFRRSPYFAIGYAANDIVLIILWTLASTKNTSYIAVVICFIAFLFNDIYGFINWQKIGKRQTEN